MSAVCFQIFQQKQMQTKNSKKKKTKNCRVLEEWERGNQNSRNLMIFEAEGCVHGCPFTCLRAFGYLNVCIRKCVKAPLRSLDLIVQPQQTCAGFWPGEGGTRKVMSDPEKFSISVWRGWGLGEDLTWEPI